MTVKETANQTRFRPFVDNGTLILTARQYFSMMNQKLTTLSQPSRRPCNLDRFIPSLCFIHASKYSPSRQVPLKSKAHDLMHKSHKNNLV